MTIFYSGVPAWIVIEEDGMLSKDSVRIAENKLYSSEGKARAAMKRQYNSDDECMYVQLTPEFLLQVWEAQQKEKKNNGK